MPKTIIRITINFRQDEWLQARDFLSAVGRGDLANAPQRRFGYTLRLANEEELAEFKALAAMFGFEGNLGPIGRERQYSSDELRSAPLLSVLYTRKAQGLGGPESGTLYDFDSGCPCCGTGARQVSELLIRGKLPEHTAMVETETGEWLLSGKLANLLDGCTEGVDLRPVRNKRTGEALPWFQMLPRVTAPPLSPMTRGIKATGQCPCCARDGHFDSIVDPFEPHYGDDVCDSPTDAMLTWEHFGFSRLRIPRAETVLARPRLLISSRLFRALLSQGVAGLSFIPVICDK